MLESADRLMVVRRAEESVEPGVVLVDLSNSSELDGTPFPLARERVSLQVPKKMCPPVGKKYRLILREEE